MLNWYIGWSMVLAAFLTGAVMGLGFHHEAFLGGYQSFKCRMVRLGHIALAAIGLMNVVFAGNVQMGDGVAFKVASTAFIVGGLAMPTVCFLSAWRTGFRWLFFIPVAALIVAVIQTLAIGHA